MSNRGGTAVIRPLAMPRDFFLQRLEDNLIELENITVEFPKNNGTIRAVDNISLKVNESEIYGVIGYSGAGKSTLIRTINLLERPISGSVKVDGEDLMKLSKKELLSRRKKIGMIFQHFNLMKNLTCLENVIFPIKKDKNMTKLEKRERALKLLERVNLLEYQDSYPSSLSGGQKQRVAIARALAGNPKILLCDEATSALDPKTTLEILELLKSLNEEFNLTIVIIAHQMEVVKEVCDKVAFMEDGKIVEEGHITDLFTAPKSELGEKFMRSVNQTNVALRNIREDKGLREAVKKGRLSLMTYKGGAATEPIVVSFYEKFSVYTNILFGNLEYIAKTSIGNLIVVFEGEEENIEKLFQYCKEKGVYVRELNWEVEDE